MHPDLRTVKCFQCLQRDEFTPLREYLTALTQRDMEHLIKQTDYPQVCRLQGRLQLGTELLRLIADAMTLADKLDR